MKKLFNMKKSGNKYHSSPFERGEGLPAETQYRQGYVIKPIPFIC